MARPSPGYDYILDTLGIASPYNNYIHNILAAAEQWKQRCLLADGSVFTEESLWTPENVGDLEQLIPVPESVSSHKERERQGWELKQKMKDARPELALLAAEAFWFISLYPASKDRKAAWKRQRFKELWEMVAPPIDQARNHMIDDRTLSGIQWVQQHHWWTWISLSYILRMVRLWKTEHPSVDMQDPPWEFIHWMDMNVDSSRNEIPMRNAVLYLLFPDYIEPVNYASQKS